MLGLLHVKSVLYLKGEAATGPTRTDLEMVGVDYTILPEDRGDHLLLLT